MMYRGTLCGLAGCDMPATHLVRLLLPRPLAPRDSRMPMEILVSAETCEAHADKAAFVSLIKDANLVERVQAFARNAGQPPLDMSRAVVRKIAKEDGDALQFVNRQ